MFKATIATICLLAAMPAMAQQTYSLGQCTRMALENNIEMKKANVGIEQAEEQKKEVFTKFFPTIRATGFAMKANKNLINYDANLLDRMPEDFATTFRQEFPSLVKYTEFNVGVLDRFFSGSVLLTQPVFAGGRIINGYKLTKLGTRASFFDLIVSTFPGISAT